MVFDKIKKLFTGGEWTIAYKRKGGDSFETVNLPKGLWAADPMLFEWDNSHYLFAEIYVKDQKKAGIGYFEFVDGAPLYKGMLIENNYHMSYPCVFAFKGEFYMIPESSANNTLELYKATHFPDKWAKEGDLLVNCSLVDTTVFEADGQLYLLSYRKNGKRWELILFSFDVERLSLKEMDKISYSTNIGRPAGYLLKKDGSFIRPAQDSSKKYGENLIMYRINSLNPLAETMEEKITMHDVKVSKKAQRVHTYSEDSEFVVIDCFSERFELFHALRIYRRSHFKKASK